MSNEGSSSRGSHVSCCGPMFIHQIIESIGNCGAVHELSGCTIDFSKYIREAMTVARMMYTLRWAR